MIFTDNSPIIACATGGVSTCAVHLIRLSGFKSIEIFNCFSLEAKKIKPRYAHFVQLKDKEEVLDEVLLTFFPAPHSYNGENILELSVHGNPLNVQRVMNFFKDDYGFRDAYGGEFSYRSLKNKKMTLSQIEGLDLFLNAQNVFSLNQGFSLLGGNFQSSFKKLYDDYIRYKASVELMIDFSEDVGDEATTLLKTNFEKLFNQIRSLKKQVINSSGQIIKPDIVLLGKPNAGKSTLFNKILGHKRAIVSSQAGTTRDYLNENWKIGANQFSLIDTAGLRETSEEIEGEGIKKAKEVIDRAFFKVLVIGTSKDLEASRNELDKMDFVLLTHADKENYSIDIESKNLLAVNLLDDNENFLQIIEEKVKEKFESMISQNPILLERHKSSILEIAKLMNNYRDLLEESEDIGIIDSELQLIGSRIGELIGVLSPERVLQHIFSNFCIGK